MADCGGENVVMEETMRTETDEIRDNLKYLTLLSRDYPSQAAAASEIISTQALLKLPKGTEHFMSDLHGENEAFVHILNSASGVIREKVDQVLGDTVPKHTRAELATLIYYPNEKLPQLKARCTSEEALDQWYTETLLRLIDICRLVSSKHTRDHVRRCLPASCGYILDELLHAHFEDHDKDLYYGQIVGSIIENGRADRFIVRLCELIKHLAVDKLHIVGDLFDRGPRPDIILDLLMRHHNVDIQWGNHDVVWMGAAAGSPICICTVLKSTLAYHNHGMLEDCYGINLRHLQRMAEQFYGNDDLSIWMPHTDAARGPYTRGMLHRCAVMHKAISILMFKLECHVIDRNPDFQMQERDYLRRIDWEKHTVRIGEQDYPLRDTAFPTVDPADPAALNDDEKLVLRADGTSVYITQDMGTAVRRFEEFDIDSLIYTVGNEQDYHFKVLFLTLKKLGYPWADKLYHLSYGMVDLPSGKMKSREGTVVDADDLMDDMYRTAKEISEELGKLDGLSDQEKDHLYHIIGMGALKYFLLKVDPRKRMMFNPQESIDFNGNTGPFIQYTYARIQSIKRRAGQLPEKPERPSSLQEREVELIKNIAEFPALIQKAAAAHSPALVANYVYELVKMYNSYYQNVPMLSAEDASVRTFRVQLSDLVGRVIRTGMYILGIEVPERM